MAISKNEWTKKLEFYDKLIDSNSKFLRKGKTMPYTSVNGHMFTFFNKDGEIGFRLSKESGKAFIENYNSTRYKSHGAFLNGYVLIPEHLYTEIEFLSQLLEESYNYVLSLKPK